MTDMTFSSLRRLAVLAFAAMVLGAAPTNAQGLGNSDDSALRALSAVALKALQPLVERADDVDRKTLGETEAPEIVLDRYHVDAEQGDGTAQTKLGLIYGKGLGVARDLISAHKWFSIASDQEAENADIYRNLVAKLMSPADVAKAQGLAREWHEKNARGITQN